MTWMIEFKNKLPRVLSCFFEDSKHLKAYLSAGSIATWISTKGSKENSISAIDQFRIFTLEWCCFIWWSSISFSSRPQGIINFYIYDFDGSTNSDWPTHDPCGGYRADQLKNVPNPHGNIFIRWKHVRVLRRLRVLIL